MRCKKCNYEIRLKTLKICPNCSTPIVNNDNKVNVVPDLNSFKDKKKSSPTIYKDIANYQTEIGGLVNRFFAFILDAVLISVISFILAKLFIPFASILVAWLYYAGMHSSPKQATLGKLIFGLKVADVNGLPINFKQASIRFVGRLFNSLTLGIGFIFILTTEYRQGLHDFIAHTCVYKKNFKKSN